VTCDFLKYNGSLQGANGPLHSCSVRQIASYITAINHFLCWLLHIHWEKATQFYITFLGWRRSLVSGRKMNVFNLASLAEVGRLTNVTNIKQAHSIFETVGKLW